MLSKLSAAARRTLTEARSAHSQLPELVKNPETVKRWLMDARHAQIALGVTFVVGLFVFPSIRDFLIDLVFPSKSQSNGFLGMSSRRVAHPMAEPAAWFFDLVYWSGGLATSAALLWRTIPEALGTVSPGAAQSKLAESNAATMQTMVQEADTFDATLGAPSTPTPVSSTPASNAPTPGTPRSQLSGRYSITRQIGAGGMGQVFLAQDTTLGRQVALKNLPPELIAHEAMRERFRREARALAQLNHAHVVQLFDFVEEEDGMWMVMEVVSGGDLEEKMEKERLPWGEVQRLGKEMAQALGAAHSRGIIHRDFKPANVMLTEEGSAKVTDFGIAKLENASAQTNTKLTQAGTLMGTPTYMSPEQARGTEVGAPSDVYSLGATLYEMLTGTPIFEGTLTQVVAAHITEAPRRFSEVAAASETPAPDAPQVPQSIETLVFAMLEKEALARPSLSEVITALGSAK